MSYVEPTKGAEVVDGHLQINNSTADTQVTGLSAPGVGSRFRVTSVLISNETATAMVALLKDGSGGAVKLRAWVNGNAAVLVQIPSTIRFSDNLGIFAAAGALVVGNLNFSVYGYKKSS